MARKSGDADIEFNGSLLIPGFSIYLMEVENQNGKRHFYIGMTGDSFYPSARAAFHRLSGHLEKKNRSTQNQLWKAIEKKIGIKKVGEYASLTFKMYHFPIPGFNEWKKDKETDTLHFENIKKKMGTTAYKDYKNVQSEVFLLEKNLINSFDKEKLLNKTTTLQSDFDFGRFTDIYKKIRKIINK